MEAACIVRSNGLSTEIHAKLLHAVVKYDKRLSGNEARKGQRVNIYRLAHLCGALNSISDAIKAGRDLRAAILKATCGRVCDMLLRAAGLPLMTQEENR
jgi:hypothetical protein